MEKILRSQILKFHNETAVKKGADDLLNTYKKTGSELLNVNLDDKATRLSKRKVFIGQETSTLIKSISLEIKRLLNYAHFMNAYTFHKTVASRLMKYFEITKLEYTSSFFPWNVNALSTPYQMKYLANEFSKVVENIEPVEGIDRIEEEIEAFHN